ncbi:Snf7-domain-containing protein [Cyathus striatus]|nr:Snf7-domain-containing protein [Cyathus striatus]
MFQTNPLLSLPTYTATSTSRLQALYADFSRQKHSNPAAFHANVEWWKKTLESFLSYGLQEAFDRLPGDRLVFHANRGLLDRLKVEGAGKPLSLSAVITDLLASKVLMSYSQFMQAKTSIYNPGWLPVRIASFFIGKPFWWALEQAGIVGEDGILTTGDRHHDWWGDYVFVSLLEHAADKVLEKQQAKVGGAVDQLYTFNSFKQEFAGVTGGGEYLKDADTNVLLKYLERDKGILARDGQVIKFVTVYSSAEERSISAVDHGILELKMAVRNLQAQVISLQHRIEECTKKASNALEQKQKSVALSYIRSRKLLQDMLEKRLGSLSILESTLISVDNAATNVEMMKTYESSAITLRTILAHPSLQRENIDKTMDALAEANADAQEIDEAVKIAVDAAVEIDENVDDTELEDELQALINEIKSGKEGDEAITRKLEGVSPPTNLPGGERKERVLAL